jgi:hypothetical protein
MLIIEPTTKNMTVYDVIVINMSKSFAKDCETLEDFQKEFTQRSKTLPPEVVDKKMYSVKNQVKKVVVWRNSHSGKFPKLVLVVTDSKDYK